MPATRTRKLALTLHVFSSVGWLGAVTASAGLAIVGLASSDLVMVRSAFVILEPLGWFVLVPLAAASLVTGLLQGTLSSWGIVRHWWVVMKLGLNVACLGILLLYTQTLAMLASDARTAVSVSDMRTASPLVHTLLAAALLLLAVVLSVYKPRGLTGWGVRRAR